MTEKRYVIIGSPGITLEHLTLEQIQDIFLGKTRRLPSGQLISLVEHPEESQAKEVFYSQVLKKKPEQVRAYWAKQVFSNERKPVTTLSGDAAIKARVASSIATIGYIEDSNVDSSVKILLKP
ncbi:MAG: hypothetical protein FD130_2184 [Halothiobacillaceae bacterium]|nr:MAG: hypothetical protein FD130_2184 [Halothiobacillaceae bacterium]